MVVILAGLCVLRRNSHKVYWLLAGGAFFYGYWDWRFLGLLLFICVFDFYLGRLIYEAEGARRKRLFVLNVVVNLSILIVFKYLNFFIGSLDAALAPLGVHVGTLNIILPIGISFFVFEVISYCVDIYRGDLKPYESLRDFALFIFFFPRMIAGPIIRASQFLPQLRRDIRVTLPNLQRGGQLFLLGLTKKLVVADRLAGFVDAVFANPAGYSAGSVWQAVIAYSIQIYCDFSGYSDMAIGLARVMGFELPENFNLPYVATSLVDFWRRWHISLSTWLRDYLYLSIGGLRKHWFNRYRNVIITMLLGGLWHGAGWNFALWGLLHGVGLAVNHWWEGFKKRKQLAHGGWWGKALGWLATFGFVTLCWVFFRAPSFGHAATVFGKMFGAIPGGMHWVSEPLLVIAPLVALAHVLGLWSKSEDRAPVLVSRRFAHLAFLFFWVVGIFFLAEVESTPFIYFQF
jgi:alginate O-acetyltransferase complex protein AlgI